MRVENLAELSRGEIVSNPSVSAFNGFSYDCQKVKSGDLFIAFDRSAKSIEQAIQNGAYGILFDDEFEVTDREIAWIKVQNINMAIMRLMRFQSSYKKLNFVAVSVLQESILKSMSLPKNTLILPEKLIDAFIVIMNIEIKSYVFCADELALQKISPVHDSIFTERKTTIQKNGSIFSSSFIHENEYYQKVAISPLFIPALSGILSFLKKKSLSFSLDNFQPIENFEPIFVDSDIKPQPFGTTRRALIVEFDVELFKYEAKSLLKILPQNNLLICKPINSVSTMDANFLYKNEKDLKELRSYNFKYALILGDKQKLLEELTKDEQRRYPSLF